MTKSWEAAPGATSAGSRWLEVSNLSVRFGDFRALDDVSLRLAPGQIHAVVGQNGAGKTTLARALMGLVKVTSGSIAWGGTGLANQGVRGARNAGFAMVHQAFTFPPSLTVAEAMEFYSPGRRSLMPFGKRRLQAEWADRLRALDVEVDTGTRIGSLPVETVQSLEIARALVSQASLLILDEPTAVLAPQEAEGLFLRLREMAAAGLTIIIVLHKVNEVLAVADTVTVLRGGLCVESARPAGDFDPIGLSSAIIGEERRVDRYVPELAHHEHHASAAHALQLEGICTGAVHGDSALADVSMSVKAGEIHGIAGVEGNGQRVLVDVVLGRQTPLTGKVQFGDVEVSRRSVGHRRSKGLRVVPFERLFEGVSRSSSIWENVGAGELTNRPQAPFVLNPRRLRRRVSEALGVWQVKYRGVDQPIGELSGGNIQRAIFAREIDDELKLLVAAQPTRGLDLGATEFVHRTLADLRASGAGVLLVSSDLDELMDMSDRISVVRRGIVVADFVRPFDRLRIGQAMVGAQ